MEHKILIAGAGGQGILFLGKLLAEAAMRQGKEVTWFPAYGAEMRGGTANCSVVISDSMIGSPVMRNPDTLIVMNAASYHRFLPRLLSGSTVLCDATVERQSEPAAGVAVVVVPAVELSAAMKQAKSANMVMAGAFAGLSGVLSVDALVKTLQAITPGRRKALLAVNNELIKKGSDAVDGTKSKDR